ncbi:transposase [Streptomyces shenzhenensis]|uniref:transposase n=1 Tax=Streptomyces shenzhenensis TaxID=943815 RepID=UPI0037FD4CE9
MAADGKGLVGQAGAVLLRRLADRVGLTRGLAGVPPSSTSAGWRERVGVLVQLAVTMVLVARSVLEAEQLQLHHQGMFSPASSDSTMRRLLAEFDDKTLMKIAKVRRYVRTLLHLRPGGFPWLTVAGRRLTGWIVVDLDATVITSASRKEGAAATFKGTFGFHPLGGWLANTGESLPMELRAGNAGANTVDDHLRILTAALDQIPHSSQSKILVCVDGAGATHGLLEHLQALNTKRRTVRCTVGWKITPEDEAAIARLPENAWETSLKQDGKLQTGYQVAELTGLNTRGGWPEGMRLIVRRVRPSRRHMEKLTAFEQKTRVRTNKAMGLANLPSQSWQINTGWMLAANLAADLDTRLWLLTLHDQDSLEDAEPDTMCLRLYHLPARLVRHARRRILCIERTWPWATAFTTSWNRITQLPVVT